ncbi:MAG: hypothetical protein WD648_00220 [Planctomycetaceae bacterium]
MKKAADFFSDDDRARINRAVADAESQTSAEIVPVVAESSGRYDRPEDIVGLWLAVICLAIVWWMLPQPTLEPGDWSGISQSTHLVALIAAVVVGFCVGAFAGSRIPGLRRLFTPAAQMRDEVRSRARAVFFDNRVHHTAGASGLLIYVSLFERMAAIIADNNVLEKLGQSTLDELCARLTQSLRTSPPTDALCEILAAAGQRLAPQLPRDSQDRNELPDALVIID